MSEHETIEEVQSPTLPKSATEHDGTSSGDSEEVSDKNEALPANLTGIIECLKEPNTEKTQSLSTAKNFEPQSASPAKEEAEFTENRLTEASAEPDGLPKESSKELDDTFPADEIVTKINEASSEQATNEKSKLTEYPSNDSCPIITTESLKEESKTVFDNDVLPSESSANEKVLTESKEHSVVPSKEKSPSVEVSTENDQTVLENPSIKSGTDVSKESSMKTNESETTQLSEEYAEHVTYTDDGIAIYTDPKTQYKYKWCETESNWIACEEEANPTAKDDGSEKSNPYENEHYRWCTETNQWIPKTTAPTSSQTETEHYRWDAEKNEWILKPRVSLDNVTYGYEDGVRTYTDKDGAVFFWDTEKKAWFPKIDDDFMARYQMSYGFIDNTSVAATEEEVKKVEPAKVEEEKIVDVPVGGVKRKAPPEPPKWFELDQMQNTKVYVSNLPLDVTMEEFAEIMSKCGMIMRDPQTQKQKLKLYTEADGQIKGDGLCDYIKVESVDLALKLLDESVVRGNKIRVQRAKFQMRGEYNPTLKPKRKKKDKEKLLKMKEKLFDWRPEKMRGERSKHEKIVIIKNLFTPELFDKEVQLIIDYQNDLREECSKCGTVRKVVIYDRHAEGVAQVNMADPDQADLVVQMMNGRFFGKRKLIADIWDGKTKYKIAETEKEVQERISKWDKYLETDEEKAEKDKARLTVPATTEVHSDADKESGESVPSA